MRLFYLSEHRSCFNYQLRYESGFSRYELTAHEEGRIDNDGCFCVLFVLKGEVLVELGREHTISVHANRMLLIPQREENRLTGITPAECLLLFWNKEITVCDKMYFDSISHEKPIATNDHTLPIRKPLLHALRQVLFYLETGLLCRHMHILKQQEIILILRGFYAKKRTGWLFCRRFRNGEQVRGSHPEQLPEGKDRQGVCQSVLRFGTLLQPEVPALFQPKPLSVDAGTESRTYPRENL